MAYTPGEWQAKDDEVWAGEVHIADCMLYAYDDYFLTHDDMPGTNKDNAMALAALPDLLGACELAANRPSEVQAMMRREGFVIDDLEDRWQKLAFTLYTYLAENATQAQAAIDKAEGKTD
ncbi:MAG TPA: hypothetical protein VM537_15655 [Anaerolineae bacterium]|nr:hypothetical protein [Anaerolineae bacterium]